MPLDTPAKVNTARFEIRVDRGAVSIDGDIDDIALVFKLLGAGAAAALEYHEKRRGSPVVLAGASDLALLQSPIPSS